MCLMNRTTAVRVTLSDVSYCEFSEWARLRCESVGIEGDVNAVLTRVAALEKFQKRLRGMGFL